MLNNGDEWWGHPPVASTNIALENRWTGTISRGFYISKTRCFSAMGSWDRISYRVCLPNDNCGGSTSYDPFEWWFFEEIPMDYAYLQEIVWIHHIGSMWLYHVIPWDTRMSEKPWYSARGCRGTSCRSTFRIMLLIRSKNANSMPGFRESTKYLVLGVNSTMAVMAGQMAGRWQWTTGKQSSRIHMGMKYHEMPWKLLRPQDMAMDPCWTIDSSPGQFRSGGATKKASTNS